MAAAKGVARSWAELARALLGSHQGGAMGLRVRLDSSRAMAFLPGP